MDEQRIDQPGVDETEAYVYFSSPGVLTSEDCKTYHAEVAYGWGAAQPLILDFAIAINLDSVPLDDQNYPEGHICDQCLMPMPFGTVAIATPISDSTQLICIACSRDNEVSRWYTQPWEIDLALVRELLTLNDGDTAGRGDVRVTRADDTVTFRLGGLDTDGSRTHCYLNLPLNRLWAFVQQIDRYLGAEDMAAVESAFIDCGIEALEALANGQIGEI